MTQPDNVFQRFDINTADISCGTILHMHEVYHRILGAMSKKSNEANGDLSTRRRKVRDEWLANFDLSPELHSSIDQLECDIFDFTFDGQVECLAAAYERLLALAGEVKQHLDDQVNRVANPETTREIVGTKKEAAQIREVASSLANIYSTIQLMNDQLPDLPNLEWQKIPPGRDIEMSHIPYIKGKVVYSFSGTGPWVSKAAFLDQLGHKIGRRLTRHDFDKYLETQNLPLWGNWSHTFEDVTIYQESRRH